MARIFPILLLGLSLALPAQAIDHYGYRVINKKSVPRDLWTQGLEIVDGKLYLSAGEYGKSRLRRYDFDTGELEIEQRLNPRLFAEGVTVLDDMIYQLTWRNRMALIFKRDTLEASRWFPLDGEGWGLTNNGRELIYSDGSHRLHYLSPQTQRITRSIEVTENGKPVPRLNELEWIKGEIWANIWQTDRIVIIDPDSGEVTASIDLAGLLPAEDRHADTDVLNGIARNPSDGSIWVTGKRWPWMYQIKLVLQKDPPASAETR